MTTLRLASFDSGLLCRLYWENRPTMARLNHEVARRRLVTQLAILHHLRSPVAAGHCGCRPGGCGSW